MVSLEVRALPSVVKNLSLALRTAPLSLSLLQWMEATLKTSILQGFRGRGRDRREVDPALEVVPPSLFLVFVRGSRGELRRAQELDLLSRQSATFSLLSSPSHFSFPLSST